MSLRPFHPSPFLISGNPEMGEGRRTNGKPASKGNKKTMGFLSVLISAVAAFLFYITGHLTLMILAIILAFGNFWSWGVLRREAQAAPNWIKWINLVFTIIGIALLFTGLTIIYK